MTSDVKLEENTVVLEGDHRIDMIAADLVLDHPQRRKNPAGMRRALVHDENDGLTVNLGGDYPGGVVIHGSVQIPEKLILGRPEPEGESNEFELIDLDRLNPDESGLTNVDIVSIDPARFDALGKSKHDRLFEVIDERRSPLDLAIEVRRLQKAVVILYERLKKLEERTE